MSNNITLKTVAAAQIATDARITRIEGMIEALLGAKTVTPAKATKATPAKAAKGKKAPAKKAAAEKVGVSMTELRLRLKEHKAAGLIVAGVSAKQALEAGLMDANGVFTGDGAAPALVAVKAPVEKATPAKAAKKGKKAKAQVAEIDADAPAKVPASEGPRRANGSITPKSEWALREALAETGKFDRHEIDAIVASNA